MQTSANKEIFDILIDQKCDAKKKKKRAIAHVIQRMISKYYNLANCNDFTNNKN